MREADELRQIMGAKVLLPNMKTKPSKNEILDAILPCREWVDEGRVYAQFVSKKEATREKVAYLKNYLNIRLANRNARHNKKDVCPVKEELYS